MLYFAYGSNLNHEQMLDRCPGYRAVGMAELRDYRLVFPLHSHTWEGGVASVQPAHGESVWGMVFELTDSDLEALDRYEGYRGPDNQHNVYDRNSTYVELTRPDDGSFPRRLRVNCYFARPSNPGPPSRRYLDAIIDGARHHRLPADYVAALAKSAVRD